MKICAFLRENKTYCFLFLIILIQLTFITTIFSTQKQGVHSDENWSYGFANAYYQKQPYLDSNGQIANFNQWVNSQLFRDYIEVSSNQRFAYDSVWYNMSEDYNPPLHSILLHTICSFFPDTFSWWYAYIINVLAFIIASFTLFKLSKELTKSDKLSLSICLIYGTLTGALSTFIYLRTYALLTAFALQYALIHCKLYNRGFKKIIPGFVGIFFLNLLGGLSHYYFLAYVLCFAVVFSVYLLVSKHFKIFAYYFFTMVLSAGAYLCIWPNALNLIQNSPDMYAAHMPLLWEIKACLQYLVGKSTGILVRYPNAYHIAIFNVCILFLLIPIVGLSFLFRNESWFRRWIRKFILTTKRFVKRLPKRFIRSNKATLFLTIICFLTMVLIAKVSNIFLMGIYFDRYLFFLMPLTTVIITIALSKIARYLLKKARKPFVVSLICIFTLSCYTINYCMFPSHYLFPRNNDALLTEDLTKDANVIIATSDDWHMVCYSSLLRNSKQFYMFSIGSLEDGALDNLESLSNPFNAPTYLIIEKAKLRAENWKKDENAPKGMVPASEALNFKFKLSDILKKVTSYDIFSEAEFVTSESGFVGTYDIYQLK